MSRRVGAPPSPGIRYGRRPGAYGVIACRGGLLVVSSGGEVQLPGGGIEPGEAPWQALVREAREETGWLIRPLRRLTVLRTHDWITEEARHAEKVMHLWLARAVRRHGPPSEPDHVPLVMGWSEAADALGPPGQGDVVRGLLRRRP